MFNNACVAGPPSPRIRPYPGGLRERHRLLENCCSGHEAVGIDLANEIIKVVRDVKIAGRIGREALRMIQLCGERRPTVTAESSGARARKRGDLATGREFPNSIVQRVRNIDISLGVRGNIVD